MTMSAKELKLDYFKFYDVENRGAEGDVLLRGQFDRRPQKMQLRLLDFFANPVSKNGEPLYDKNAHLAWYRGVRPSEPLAARGAGEPVREVRRDHPLRGRELE